MSCIVILKKYYHLLKEIERKNVQTAEATESPLYVDFELIVRSIIGMNYDIRESSKREENKIKNVVVGLINSSIFDMDKLDYLMRDAYLTGIGTPQIDTHRLFRNMYLYDSGEYNLVFTQRAIPSLQNMISSRDELYMYVYNHHAAGLSDFMMTYIFRRLDHNVQTCEELILKKIKEYNKNQSKDKDKDVLYRKLKIFYTRGLVPKKYVFSTDRVMNDNFSDSDLVALIHQIKRDLTALLKNDVNLIQFSNELQSVINEYLVERFSIDAGVSADEINEITKQIERTYDLICKYTRREYLKPWWKTNVEFASYLNTYFRDDNIRTKLCEWICGNGKNSPESEEFRSQLAKSVIYVANKAKAELGIDKSGIIENLNDGDFFIIERSAQFLETEKIRALDIALKENEILGAPGDSKKNVGEYYIKEFTNVIPQRDYYAMYAKNSFYIFSKRVENESLDSEKIRKHYRAIEQIFVVAANYLIRMGKHSFSEEFCSKKAEDEMNRVYELIYEKYIEKYFV